MIVFFHAGRLGNQIFEYAFLNKIKSKDEIIVSSKCAYFDIFEYEQKDFIFINKYLRFLLRRFVKALCLLRIFTLIRQDQEFTRQGVIDLNTYTLKTGLIKNIKMVEGFFQASDFITHKPKLKPEVIKDAKEFLGRTPEGAKNVFVHIRRGDYLDFSVLGKDNPTLPQDFYVSSIREFQDFLSNPFFIFLTDDPVFVESEFSFIENKVISDKPVGVDLAIMSLCDYGLTSNSTLSWWGAYLMRNHKRVISPKYWLGWKSKQWFPKGIDCKIFEFKEV